MMEAGALEELEVVIKTTAAMEEAMTKETTTDLREATNTIKIPFLPKRNSSYVDSLRENALNIIYRLNIPVAAAQQQD